MEIKVLIDFTPKAVEVIEGLSKAITGVSAKQVEATPEVKEETPKKVAPKKVVPKKEEASAPVVEETTPVVETPKVEEPTPVVKEEAPTPAPVVKEEAPKVEAPAVNKADVRKRAIALIRTGHRDEVTALTATYGKIDTLDDEKLVAFSQALDVIEG